MKSIVLILFPLILVNIVLSFKVFHVNCYRGIRCNERNDFQIFERKQKLSLEDDKEWLRQEAARLRAEAEELEQEQRDILARIVEGVFEDFDLNKDGSVSLDELRLGLRRELRDELAPELVEKLMKAFDSSGDGKLQLNEFKSIEVFKKKLDEIMREEKYKENEVVASTRKAKAAAEKAAMLAELINDRPPTFADRWVSILPYLVPLFDSFQYGIKFLSARNDELTTILSVFYSIYASIPFSGLIAFFALSFIANNTKLNRLIRFNIQQAIYIDIALILPTILSGIFTVGLPYAGIAISPETSDLASTVTFLVFSSAIIYCLVSSLIFGQPPNKIPIISDRAEDRVQALARVARQMFTNEEDDENKKPKNF